MSLEEGQRVLRLEAEAILALAGRLDARFHEALSLLEACRGKVVMTGIGKSGLVAQKIAATFTSTGTPAMFLHAAEGLHGDLGVLARGDVVLVISYSGETDEILRLLPAIKRLGLAVISFTGHLHSTLAKSSDVVLDVNVREEGCPLGLSPMASTTATLAMGDALAVALLRLRGFTADDFAHLHPAGTLGRRLLLRVQDVMHTGTEIPLVHEHTPMPEAIMEISSKRLGITAVVDGQNQLSGVITDGDLRRLLEREREGVFRLRAGEVMTHAPKVIRRDALAAEAVQRMEQHAITVMLIVDGERRIEGIVHLHDLLKIGVA